MSTHWASLVIVVSFIVGFVTASYVWAVTMDRVTLQHRIELECLKRGDC